MTKEQVYQKQMEDLGIWQEIFLPELRTLCRCERELTRAEKAWSATAAPGGKPSFLDDHYPIIQSLRKEIMQHRESLGITAKALAKITGAGSTAPDQGDLISSKLDAIAERVAGYDVSEIQVAQDMYETLPEAQEAARISDLMDRQDAAENINERLAKGVGPGPRGKICQAADGPWYAEDYDLSAAVAEDMG